MTPSIVPLGELCDMDRRGLRPEDPDAVRLPLLGVEHVGSDTGTLNLDTSSRVGDGKSTSFRFDARHVLYAKLRPYLNKVATPDFCGRCSTELVPLLPRRGVNRDFLAYLLRRRETVAFVMSSVTGSRMPCADMKALMSMRVPLPPLEEQRRIVDILNRAARIETLRARAAEVERAAPNVLLPDKIWRFVWRDDSAIEPVYMDSLFKTSSVRAALSTMATGTSGSMKNIAQSKLKTLPIPLPPLALQRRYTGMVEAARAVARVGESGAGLAATVMASLRSELLGDDVADSRTCRASPVGRERAGGNCTIRMQRRN